MAYTSLHLTAIPLLKNVGGSRKRTIQPRLILSTTSHRVNETLDKAVHFLHPTKSTAESASSPRVLAIASCNLVGGDEASAVEMFHTMSLIHDDLLCMDDDRLRRGNPANHVVFGKYVVILAGDALNTLAFLHVMECRKVSVSADRVL